MNDQARLPDARDGVSRPVPPRPDARAPLRRRVEPDLFEPKALLRLARRDAWRIGGITLAALGCGAWFLATATPQYRATATVVLDTREAQVVDSQANAADVFSSERFGEFLDEMRERYDFIFIDTPPVLAVPDARVIAGRADAVLYAVRWNATGKEMVKAGLELFEQIGVRVTGLALTQANPKKLGRYGYAGYGYGYGYGATAAKKYYTT